MNSFLGLNLIESPLCEMRVPVKRHKRRRHQSAAYHTRIQKKWTKRFGLKSERVALFFNGHIALHPSHMAMIRNFT